MRSVWFGQIQARIQRLRSNIHKRWRLCQRFAQLNVCHGVFSKSQKGRVSESTNRTNKDCKRTSWTSGKFVGRTSGHELVIKGKKYKYIWKIELIATLQQLPPCKNKGTSTRCIYCKLIHFASCNIKMKFKKNSNFFCASISLAAT